MDLCEGQNINKQFGNGRANLFQIPLDPKIARNSFVMTFSY